MSNTDDNQTPAPEQTDAPAENSAAPSKSTKLLTGAVIAAMAGLVFTVEVKRQEAHKQLANLTSQIEQTVDEDGSNRTVAQNVVLALRKHISIPGNIEPTVAKIVDVETLQEKNPFYNAAKNGDYLVVTTERAILYDPASDVVLDVVPVRITPIEAASDTVEGVSAN